MRETVTFLAVAVLSVAVCQEYKGRHALFVRAPIPDAHSRVQRAAPASPAEVTAQNILEWIQGIYQQGTRKIRQQSDVPGYLPPYSTQRPPEKPRPFQAASTSQQSGYQRLLTGFSPASLNLSPGQLSTLQALPFSTQKPTYLPPSNQSPFASSSTSYNPRPTSIPSYSNTGSTAFPPYSSTRSSSSYQPPSIGLSSTPLPPSVPTRQTPLPGFSSSNGFSSTGGLSSSGAVSSTNEFASSGGFSTNFGYSTSTFESTPSDGFSVLNGFSTTSDFLTEGPSSSYIPTADTSASSFDLSSDGYSSNGGYNYGYQTERPTHTFSTFKPAVKTGQTTRPPPTVPPTRPPTQVGSGGSSGPLGPQPSITEESRGAGETKGSESTNDDDLNHPPHIHNFDVECSKTMMIIYVEFNRVFNGIIYSKGFFWDPECIYVNQDSGQMQYTFTVSLDSCGTQFMNGFVNETIQAYLENVLVFQNEPGIQEVWDMERRIRCLWENSIDKILSANLTVDMLSQTIKSFNGDTATARMDIQVGFGPYAPLANGLVKIGQNMTLVISVEEDPSFDIQVRNCIAHDGFFNNTIELTDERGCTLRPKLFGAFQKTNDTRNAKTSVIAYAYFQAFKFLDQMDLFIDCNVTLCKVNCIPCPDENQQIEPGRRRRSITYTPPKTNSSAVLLSDPIRIGRGFRVIMLDDLSEITNQAVERLEESAVEEITRTTTNVCMTYSGFYTVVSLILSTITLTTISAVTFYVKLQRVYRSKFINS